MTRYEARHSRRDGRPRRRPVAFWLILLIVAVAGVAILYAVDQSGGTKPGAPAASRSSGTTGPPGRTGSTGSTLPATSVAGGSGAVTDSIGASWVIEENQRPGTTSWQISGTPPGVIAGFANRTSAAVGDTVTLYVN